MLVVVIFVCIMLWIVVCVLVGSSDGVMFLYWIGIDWLKVLLMIVLIVMWFCVMMLDIECLLFVSCFLSSV